LNQPEYILVDEIGACVAAAKTALSLSVLNYQYGYVHDVEEKLKNFDKSATYAALKFPLVWLVQPFTIVRDGNFSYFGKVTDLEIFIISQSVPNKDTATRMTDNFKPIIYPIVRELTKQFSKSLAFAESVESKIIYRQTDMHYWGPDQNKVITDVFDCTRISGLNLTINNNKNCSPEHQI
jgi:hypothetical protein